jgi:hypothetical protein
LASAGASRRAKAEFEFELYFRADEDSRSRQGNTDPTPRTVGAEWFQRAAHGAEEHAQFSNKIEPPMPHTCPVEELLVLGQ